MQNCGRTIFIKVHVYVCGFKNEHFNSESIREKYNSDMVFDSVDLVR